MEQVSLLQVFRITAKEHDIERRFEKVNMLLEESETQLESKSTFLDKLRLSSLLLRFVKLNKDYVETLELIEKADATILSALQEGTAKEDGRYKEVMESFADLIISFDQINKLTIS